MEKSNKNCTSEIITKILPVVKVFLLQIVMSFLFILLISFILLKTRLSDDKIIIGVGITYAVVNFIGGFLLGRIKESKRYIWGLIAGVLYFVCLLIVSLFIKGTNTEGMQVMAVFAICSLSGMAGGMLS